MVYLTGWAQHLIETHYRPCGLDGVLLQYLEELPKYMSMKLGGDEGFWREELDNNQSKIHRLNLVEGAINYAIETSRNYAESQNEEICTYLKESIEKDWILNWLTGYISSMKLYPQL